MHFSLKHFKQRLQDHGNLIISLEQGIIKLDVLSQPENPEAEPSASQTSETESKLVLRSASDLPGEDVKKDEEKPEGEMTTDLSAPPKTKDDRKESILESTLHSTADGTAKEAAPLSEEPLFNEMKGEILKVMTESASQHKDKKDINMEENAVSFGYYSLTIHV